MAPHRSGTLCEVRDAKTDALGEIVRNDLPGKKKPDMGIILILLKECIASGPDHLGNCHCVGSAHLWRGQPQSRDRAVGATYNSERG
jgi:hypothetical protein